MKYFFAVFFLFASLAQAAVFKHEGLSNGQKQYEWFSESSDPSPSNPYKDGRYPNLTFRTTSASASDSAAYLVTKNEEALRTARKTRLDAVQAIKDATPGSLTDVQRDRILLYLLKKELGE